MQAEVYAVADLALIDEQEDNEEFKDALVAPPEYNVRI